MCIGMVVGYTIFPKKLYKPNSWLQTACTAVLIFSMGVSLGSRPNLISELKDLGIQSLVFSIVPIVFSILFVYPLTKKFMEGRHGNNSDS